MSVIDLGDVSYLPDEPEGYPGGRREFERADVRRLVKAAITVLAVLLLGGSGLPGPPVLREVWSVPFSEADSMTIAGDALFVHRSRLGQGELTAYELATGSARWTRDTGRDPIWLGTVPVRDVLLVPGDEQTVEVESPEDGSTITYTYTGSLTALDPATGKPLWKRPGTQYWGDTGDTLLMFERDRTGVFAWLRLIRTVDGSTVWEQRAPAKTDVVEVQFDGDTPARVVTATPAGELTVLRYADGAFLVSGIVPWQPTSADTGTGSQLSTVSGRIVVVDNGLGGYPDRSRVSVYRAGDLALLWRRDTTGWPNVQDCGPVVCLNTTQGFFEAVDPDTGEKRWDMIGGGVFADVTVDGRRMLIAGTDDRPRQTVVETATGRAIGPGGSGLVLALAPEAGTVTLQRDLGLTQQSVISRLDTTTGRSVTLGAISGGNQRFCSGGGRWIACSLGDRLVVTAVG